MFLFVIWRSFYLSKNELNVIRFFCKFLLFERKATWNVACVLVCFVLCASCIVKYQPSLIHWINAKPFKRGRCDRCAPILHIDNSNGLAGSLFHVFHRPMLSLRLFVVLSNNVIEFIKNDVMHALNPLSIKSMKCKLGLCFFLSRALRSFEHLKWALFFELSNNNILNGVDIEISLVFTEHMQKVRLGATANAIYSEWHTRRKQPNDLYTDTKKRWSQPYDDVPKYIDENKNRMMRARAQKSIKMASG